MIQQSPLWYLPKGAGNARPHRNRHMGVHSSFIHSCQNSSKRGPSVGEWINKLWNIQTMEYYSALKRNKLSSWKDMEETYMHITKWKKPVWKGSILCESNLMTFWERQNYGDSVIKGRQGSGGGGMNRRSMEDSSGSETSLWCCHSGYVSL